MRIRYIFFSESQVSARAARWSQSSSIRVRASSLRLPSQCSNCSYERVARKTQPMVCSSYMYIMHSVVSITETSPVVADVFGDFPEDDAQTRMVTRSKVSPQVIMLFLCTLQRTFVL